LAQALTADSEDATCRMLGQIAHCLQRMFDTDGKPDKNDHNTRPRANVCASREADVTSPGQHFGRAVGAAAGRARSGESTRDDSSRPAQWRQRQSAYDKASAQAIRNNWRV
jgi:hypothetical protein